MHGRATRDADTSATSPAIKHNLNGSRHEGCRMDEGAILIAGVGGIGCTGPRGLIPNAPNWPTCCSSTRMRLPLQAPQQHTACTSMQGVTAEEQPRFPRWPPTVSETA